MKGKFMLYTTTPYTMESFIVRAISIFGRSMYEEIVDLELLARCNPRKRTIYQISNLSGIELRYCCATRRALRFKPRYYLK